MPTTTISAISSQAPMHPNRKRTPDHSTGHVEISAVCPTLGSAMATA